MTIPSADTGEFGKSYQGLSTSAEQMKLLAIVLAHEVGHSLGLLHPRKFNGTGYALGAGVGTMFDIGSPTADRQLGPVHVAVLKKHYP